MTKAVVLLSGGLDSTTTLAIAKAGGFMPYALSFRYGQRHVVELSAAQRVAKALGVAEHVIVDIDLRRFGGSALTADIPVLFVDGQAEGIPARKQQVVHQGVQGPLSACAGRSSRRRPTRRPVGRSPSPG